MGTEGKECFLKKNYVYLRIKISTSYSSIAQVEEQMKEHTVVQRFELYLKAMKSNRRVLSKMAMVRI